MNKSRNLPESFDGIENSLSILSAIAINNLHVLGDFIESIDEAIATWLYLR